MTRSFNLCDEYDFASIFPCKIKSGKEQLQRDLLLDLIRTDFSVRGAATRDWSDVEVDKSNSEKIEALAVALQALKEEE